ncbi:hypothetical protein OCU04_004080 [Sclerotinia nivalis]|uniref:Uncharacterized protein n=1 Tax=Sclerotinia nivalis TaxID=352851 RepID=A0A9X0ATR9_9HELO|nr:hypothetical protein OCU04_004080 [Sclerotinia nivalis]
MSRVAQRFHPQFQSSGIWTAIQTRRKHTLSTTKTNVPFVATGRISPLGNFTGFDDSTEYFFTLSPIPGQTGVGILLPSYNAFTSYQLHSSPSGCPEVASTVVYLNTTVVHPGSHTNRQYVTRIKEIAFWRFDDTGAVLYYDANS